MEATKKEGAFARLRQLCFFCFGTSLAVYADRCTKLLALSHLEEGARVPLLPGILELLRIENRGAAFGILQGHMPFFYFITALVALLILFAVLRTPAKPRYRLFLIALSMIAAGAIGNLIDRVTRKSVVDFIYFVPIDFPVFNVADIFVTCGTALLAVLLCFFYKDEEFDFLKLRRTAGEEKEASE